MDRVCADHNGIGGSAQQAHNEAICVIGTADGRATGIAGNGIADDAVERGYEICKDVRPPLRSRQKTQVAIVEFLQAWRKDRFNGLPVPIEKSFYWLHYFTLLLLTALAAEGALIDRQPQLLAS